MQTNEKKVKMNVQFLNHTVKLHSEEPYMTSTIASPVDGKSVQSFNFHDIEFKMASEHTVNSAVYPLEIQFSGMPDVNKSLVTTEGLIDNRSYRKLIYSQLVSEGQNKYKGLQSFMNIFDYDMAFDPPKIRPEEFKKGEIILEYEFDALQFIPDNKFLYQVYEGSDTSPPCSENVLWVVRLDPIKVVDPILMNLDLMFSHKPARSLQKLNRRPVVTE